MGMGVGALHAGPPGPTLWLHLLSSHALQRHSGFQLSPSEQGEVGQDHVEGGGSPGLPGAHITSSTFPVSDPPGWKEDETYDPRWAHHFQTLMGS